MTPAFGLVEAKALYPCFVRCSNSVSHCLVNDDAKIEGPFTLQLADKWHDTISNAVSGQATTIDVYSWLSKATLDAYVAKSTTSVSLLIGRDPA